MEREKHSRAATAFGIIMVISMVGVPIGIGIGILGWLKNGYYPATNMAAVWEWLGLGHPSVSWIGMQRIINLYMGLSATYALPLTGAILSYFMMLYAQHVHDDRVADEKAKARFVGPPKPEPKPSKAFRYFAFAWAGSVAFAVIWINLL